VQTAVVDLFDPASLQRAMVGHDTVINLATHIPSSALKMMFRRNWAENDRIRSTGVRNLVDAAIASGVTRFIQESFAPIYPDRGDEWIDERMPLEPPSYSHSVLDAEAALASFAGPGRTGIVLRFGAFYGPDATQLHALIRAMRLGIAPLPGGPRGFISSVSHDDAASAVVAALGAIGSTYNVVDDEPLRRGEYVESLANALHVRRPRLLPAWMTPMLGTIGFLLARSLRISNRKFREASGWRPRYPSVRSGWPAILAETPAALAHGTV
jgi:nucleoside-diphosphate-sugar epimerase